MVYTKEFGYLEAAPLRLAYHPEKQKETLQQFVEYYADMTTILTDQMGTGENFNRFAKRINEAELCE